MHFKQLEAFIKVVELGSFSKAAEALYISQPSISAYVQSLEKELDALLINRSTKEISPTAAGAAFYDSATEILALKDKALDGIKSLSKNPSGEINIIASTVPSLYILPRLIAGFREAYPEVAFTVKQGDTWDVAQGVAAKRHDLGFAGSAVPNDKCVYEAFLIERLVLITPNGKTFQGAEEPSLEELLYENPFVSREKGSGTKIEYEKYFKEQGVDMSRIRVRAGFDNTQSVINAVMNGLGVSVVSEYAARDFIAKEMVRAVNLPNLPTRTIYVVLKKGAARSYLLELFLGFLRGKGTVV